VQRRTLTACCAALMTLSTTVPALAHGPTRQKVVETVAIDAPAAKVWERIRNFDALEDWHPAVAKSPSSKGNEVGAVRTLELKNGKGLIETLEAYDDKAMKMSYRAKDGGALPVTNYSSTITVSEQGANKAKVEWRGAFYRGYPNNDPPPDQNDEAAVRAVTGVYRDGLANLKKVVEGK
jgi:carbon monoxide dehydrogenase subunit G